MTSRPRILVLSFSPVARDARVMRHVSVASRLGDVVTCGFGERPAGVDEHVRVPDLHSLPQTPLGVALLAAHRFAAAERVSPAQRAAADLLRGKHFDVVVCNDARALPVAFEAADGAPVWVDLHEWAPQERSHDLRWRLLVGPLATYQCRRYLPRAAAVTTVAESIADLYRRDFGVDCDVVRNAAPYVDLEPSPVRDDVVRLVHSGGAVPGRNIEMLVRSAVELGPGFTLDLYLVPANDGGRYLRALRAEAEGSDRVRFHDPVAPSELPATLNPYDVGVYSIPPINVNTRLALPNKFFDFVQARLAVAIGPSVEMARLTTENDLGVVAADFGQESFTETVRALTPEAVRRFKANADTAARALSSDADQATTSAVLSRLLGR